MQSLLRPQQGATSLPGRRYGPRGGNGIKPLAAAVQLRHSTVDLQARLGSKALAAEGSQGVLEYAQTMYCAHDVAGSRKLPYRYVRYIMAAVAEAAMAMPLMVDM
jgi:hypothetical protein